MRVSCAFPIEIRKSVHKSTTRFRSKFTKSITIFRSKFTKSTLSSKHTYIRTYTYTYLRNRCSSNWSAVSLTLGSGSKHCSRKSLALSESVSGISGCCWYIPTLKMAASGEPSSVKGGFPVAISTTVQPRDQMSAYKMFTLCSTAHAHTHIHVHIHVHTSFASHTCFFLEGEVQKYVW